MIIVNQEKTYLVNFNNVCQVSLAVDEEETEYAIAVQTVDKEEIIMGIYKTEERVKEVLQEIMSAFSDFEYFKSTKESIKENIGIKIFANYGTMDVYKMPEE